MKFWGSEKHIALSKVNHGRLKQRPVPRLNFYWHSNSALLVSGLLTTSKVAKGKCSFHYPLNKIKKIKPADFAIRGSYSRFSKHLGKVRVE